MSYTAQARFCFCKAVLGNQSLAFFHNSMTFKAVGWGSGLSLGRRRGCSISITYHHPAPLLLLLLWSPSHPLSSLIVVEPSMEQWEKERLIRDKTNWSHTTLSHEKRLWCILPHFYLPHQLVNYYCKALKAINLNIALWWNDMICHSHHFSGTLQEKLAINN